MTVKTILRNPVVAAVMGATLVATPVGVLYMSGSTRPADAAEQSLVTQQPMAPVSSGPSAGVGPATKAVPTVNALPDFRALVQSYGSAVVNISVSGDMKPVANHSAPPGFGDDNPFFRFFGMPMAPGQTVPMQGQGSGFIVGPEGTILTNAHVVDGARKVIVKLTDHREFEARVVGVDKKSDVAMLKIDARDLPVVKLGDPTSLEVGEWVVAIGSPFGFENSVTAGIVSATGRSLPDDTYVPFIQTDVAVNPGNSGGPLFNLRGEVVGMNSQIYSRSGGYEGVSFAIPIDVAMNVGQQLQTLGPRDARPAWRGHPGRGPRARRILRAGRAERCAGLERRSGQSGRQARASRKATWCWLQRQGRRFGGQLPAPVAAARRAARPSLRSGAMAGASVHCSRSSVR